jgi:hypothetical protein
LFRAEVLAFRERYPAADSIRLEANGSALGMEQLVNGEVEMSLLLRELTDPEVEAAVHRDGLQAFPFAWDAVAVIVNPGSPIEQISRTELAAIYRGELTDWSAMGWKRGGSIVALTPGPKLGVFAYLEQTLLSGGTFASTVYAPSSERDALGSPECRPVGRKPDDCGARRICAEAAVDALEVLPVALGADDHIPAFGGVLDVAVRGIGRQDHDHRARLFSGECVCVLECVGRQVDRKAGAVGSSDRRQVVLGRVLVAVCEATLASVCRDKIGEHLSVDLLAVAGKIPADVVPPERVFGEVTDGLEKSLPADTGLARREPIPLPAERPMLGIAAVSAKGTARRTSNLRAHRDGDGPGLAVLAGSNECDSHSNLRIVDKKKAPPGFAPGRGFGLD